MNHNYLIRIWSFLFEYETASLLEFRVPNYWLSKYYCRETKWTSYLNEPNIIWRRDFMGRKTRFRVASLPRIFQDFCRINLMECLNRSLKIQMSENNEFVPQRYQTLSLFCQKLCRIRVLLRFFYASRNLKNKCRNARPKTHVPK